MSAPRASPAPLPPPKVIPRGIPVKRLSSLRTAIPTPIRRPQARATQATRPTQPTQSTQPTQPTQSTPSTQPTQPTQPTKDTQSTQPQGPRPPKPKKKPKTTCPNPGCPAPEVVKEDGKKVCVGCGTVVSEIEIVSEVSFGESSSGAAIVQGTFVGADQSHGRSFGPGFQRGGGMESREITEQNGRYPSIHPCFRLFV